MAGIFGVAVRFRWAYKAAAAVRVRWPDNVRAYGACSTNETGHWLCAQCTVARALAMFEYAESLAPGARKKNLAMIALCHDELGGWWRGALEVLRCQH